MWKKWKESDLWKRMKKVRVNRAVYIGAIVVLLALAVVLTVTAVANRAKKKPVDNLPTGTTASTPQNSVVPPMTKLPSEDSPTVTPETVPELALPVSGRLNKNHSVDIQVFSQTLKDYRTHLGIDITTAANAPVCSVADGTVSQIWEDPMMGWCVAVTHRGDCISVYKNLSEVLAEGMNTGVEVKQGQLLGYVGDSAMIEIAEEPHLHLEITVAGLQVDPLEYFSDAVIATLSKDTAYEENADSSVGK